MENNSIINKVSALRVESHTNKITTARAGEIVLSVFPNALARTKATVEVHLWGSEHHRFKGEMGGQRISRKDLLSDNFGSGAFEIHTTYDTSKGETGLILQTSSACLLLAAQCDPKLRFCCKDLAMLITSHLVMEYGMKVLRLWLDEKLANARRELVEMEGGSCFPEFSPALERVERAFFGELTRSLKMPLYKVPKAKR